MFVLYPLAHDAHYQARQPLLAYEALRSQMQPSPVQRGILADQQERACNRARLVARAESTQDDLPFHNPPVPLSWPARLNPLQVLNQRLAAYHRPSQAERDAKSFLASKAAVVYLPASKGRKRGAVKIARGLTFMERLALQA